MGYEFKPKPDGHYMQQATTLDMVFNLAQEMAYQIMVTNLTAWVNNRHQGIPCDGYLATAQKYANAFSEATACREHHRATYHKAFPESDVFRFPQYEGQNLYWSVEEDAHPKPWEPGYYADREVQGMQKGE